MSAAKTPAKPRSQKAKPATAKRRAKKKPAHDEDIHPAARPFLWLVSDGARKGFLYLVGIAALISIVADFFVERHAHFHYEHMKGFFAIFGFVAFSFVVLMGWPLRKLTARPEDYYPESREDD